jgi:ATP-dependent exoDNAse (exonuclease V) alpha subunit
MGYSTKRSNRHFLRATLSRSISSANRTTARHEFSIPAHRSLATGRWARGLHRNTNAYPSALERVLASEMRNKLIVELTPAATFGPASRRFKTADAIAMKLGIEKIATIRVRAGISYALTEAMEDGHCGLPTEELMPLAETADGIQKYLSSGMIRGIGPAYAEKLVRPFGEKVFDVIEATPERLREVDGIGPIRAAEIAAWDASTFKTVMRPAVKTCGVRLFSR